MRAVEVVDKPLTHHFHPSNGTKNNTWMRKCTNTQTVEELCNKQSNKSMVESRTFNDRKVTLKCTLKTNDLADC